MEEKNQKTFEERIHPYKNIWLNWITALESAEEIKLEGAELEAYLCRSCRAYFFERYLKVEREASDQEIRDINKSPIVPFQLSRVQLDKLDRFEARMNEGKKFQQRIMKCRRAQISTIYLAIGYHICRFSENKKGYVFCDRLDTARKLKRILDVFYQNDNFIDKPEIGKRTMSEGLYLHNPSLPKDETSRDSFILLGSGEQKNSGIGGSLDWMIWSEAALTNDADTHWTTISPSLKGALFDIAESTPSLTGQDSVIFPAFDKPSPNCDAMFVSWIDIDEYEIDMEKGETFTPHLDHNLYGKEVDIVNEYNPGDRKMKWRRYKLDELKNLNAFRQVFPISKEEAFYSSAGLFFHKDLIRMTKPKEERLPDQILFSDQGTDVSAFPDSTGLWKMYNRRMPNYEYLISADSAEGKCADKEQRDPDYSTAIVFKIGSPVEEVCFLRERIPPEIFGEQLAVAGRYYNNALIVPERNGPGLAVILRLCQLYSNIFRQQKYQGGSFVMTQDYGVVTTSPSKVHALSCLLSQIRDKEKGLILHSDIIRHEMSKYASIGMKYSALPGNHDDTITCLWIMALSLTLTPGLLSKVESGGQTIQSMEYIEPKIARENSWQFE